MFASEPMNLVFDSQKKTTISSSVPFTGVVRIAYIPAKDPTDQSTETSTGLRRLIYHAGSYPVGGQVSWEFPRPTNSKYKSTVGKSTSPRANDSSRVATVHFNYATSAMSDNSLRTNAAADTLLMLALPHHAQLLPKSMLLNAKHFDLHYRCIKGRMTPVVGSTWSYDEPFPDLEFDAPMQGMDPLLRQTLLDQLEEDITLVLPTATENIYGFGKQVARLAQITHIAYQLGGSSGETASDDQASGILEQASSLLSEHLGNLLSGDVADGLVFDSNLGGVVSKNGLSNKEEDFGNGR